MHILYSVTFQKRSIFFPIAQSIGFQGNPHVPPAIIRSVFNLTCKAMHMNQKDSWMDGRMDVQTASKIAQSYKQEGFSQVLRTVQDYLVCFEHYCEI